jgi:hypothetical protein
MEMFIVAHEDYVYDELFDELAEIVGSEMNLWINSF